MNIWILNHYAIPPDTPGGTRHFDFASELIKRGHQVTIFASGFNHRTKKEERLKKGQNYRREKIDGVEFIWIRTPPYERNDWRRVVNMLGYSFRIIPLGLSFKERPDIILASSPHPFAGLAGYILAVLKKARFIFEVRDLWPQTFVGIGGYSRHSPVVKLLRVLEKFLYRRARKIIVLLPGAIDYVARLGIPSDKVIYIPNGVDPELFYNTGVKIPEELEELLSGSKSKGKLLVGYTGAHGIANALDTIIEVAKLLQEQGIDKIHFLLVGDGPEKERLMGKAKSWGLNHISFFQSVPKNAMFKLLKAIDVAVISAQRTDLYEYGMSLNKLWDYMICANPVVWAIDSANNPVAEANCGLTVPPEDSEKMAEAIVALCDMSEHERQVMGMRGYEYVMKYHSMPVLTDRLLEAIRDAKMS